MSPSLLPTLGFRLVMSSDSKHPCPNHTNDDQQDATPGHTYERVIYFLIAVKAVDIFVGPVYDYLDGKWLGHSLRMPEKKRVAFRQKVLQDNIDLRGWRVEKPVFVSVTIIMTVWIIVGWVVSVQLLRGQSRLPVGCKCAMAE